MTAHTKHTEETELTVAQLAITQPGALSVFTKYNIDYCCGGHRSLEEACHRKGLDADKILEEIHQTPPADTTQKLKPESWNSDFLVDFIIHNHHMFVRRAIPELDGLLTKVCDRHGNDCLELLKMRECFMELAEELTSHMEKEEGILFPAIKKVASQNLKDSSEMAVLKPVIHAMEHEHEEAGALIKQIRAFSNAYTPPDFACPTYQVTYRKLQEFDNDLMQHIHLENNILFPRFKNS